MQDSNKQPTAVVGAAVVGEPVEIKGLPEAPWERMKIVNEMREAGGSIHLPDVRTIMVGDRGPPLDEEVAWQPFFCCLCFLCCDPCRPLIDKLKGQSFRDERIDRPWTEILSDVLDMRTIFWLLVCLAIFASWFYVAALTNVGMMLTMFEGQVQIYFSMMYFDFIPNVMTAYVYHQYKFWHPLHKAEHKYIFQSEGIHTQFSVGAAYFVYFNFTTAPIYVLTILPALITGKVDTHWECAIFFATFIQTIVMFCVRILMWVMEQRPSMYSYAPTSWLNFLRFFKTHFTMAAFEYYDSGRYKGRTMSTGYGNVMPFFDVLIGSCPFNVHYSVPFPYIDFITHSSKVWCEYVDPADIKWSPLQKLWYALWCLVLIVVAILSFGTYWAPWGSCFPWEYDGADLWFAAMQPFSEWKLPGHGHSVPTWAPILILVTLLLTFVFLAWLALYFRRYFRDEEEQCHLPTPEATMPALEVTMPALEVTMTMPEVTMPTPTPVVPVRSVNIFLSATA